MARSSISKLASRRRIDPEPEPVVTIVPPPAPAKRSHRDGKKAVTLWLYKDAYRTLQRLALDQETTTRAKLEQALDLLFQAEGVADMRATDEERKKRGLSINTR